MQPLIDADILPEGYYFNLPLGTGVHSGVSGRELKGYIGENGYLYFTFSDGTRQYFHRLICRAVYGPSNGRVVNHKDGDKLNNHPDNLEWCSHSENLKHSHSSLSRKKIDPYNHPNRTLSDKDILEIFHSAEPQRIIAERYGTSARTVFNIRKGIRHSRVTGKEVVCPTVNR